jgi:hypothetical protein
VGGKICKTMVKTIPRLGRTGHNLAIVVVDVLENLVDRNREKVAELDTRLISAEQSVVVTVAFSGIEAVSLD